MGKVLDIIEYGFISVIDTNNNTHKINLNNCKDIVLWNDGDSISFVASDDTERMFHKHNTLNFYTIKEQLFWDVITK